MYGFYKHADYLSEQLSYREVLHPLSSSPNGVNTWDLAMLKPGARSFFWLPHMGTGIQTVGLSSLLSQAHCQGGEMEVKQLGLELAPVWDASTAGAALLDVSQHYTPK